VKVDDTLPKATAVCSGTLAKHHDHGRALAVCCQIFTMLSIIFSLYMASNLLNVPNFLFKLFALSSSENRPEVPGLGRLTQIHTVEPLASCLEIAGSIGDRNRTRDVLDGYFDRKASVSEIEPEQLMIPST
jgi:hypothetical protein